MITASLVVLMAADAWSAQQPMDLIAALEQGQIEAVFYGNGDQSVRGRIRRSPHGPSELYVPPGTQFWAQREDRQGMTTLGYVPIDLRRRATTYVTIPTACTNLALNAPTGFDIMIPTRCPDARMEVLCTTIGRIWPARAVSQLAVWDYAQGHAAGDDEDAKTAAAEVMRSQAAELLRAAGLDPAGFAMLW
jgi:hypothetical protein